MWCWLSRRYRECLYGGGSWLKSFSRLKFFLLLNPESDAYFKYICFNIEAMKKCSVLQREKNQFSMYILCCFFVVCFFSFQLNTASVFTILIHYLCTHIYPLSIARLFGFTSFCYYYLYNLYMYCHHHSVIMHYDQCLSFIGTEKE